MSPGRKIATLIDEPEAAYQPVALARRVDSKALIPAWHIVLLEKRKPTRIGLRSIYYTYCERILYPLKYYIDARGERRYRMYEYEKTIVIGYQAHKEFLVCQTCIEEYIEFLRAAKIAARKQKARLDNKGYTSETISRTGFGMLTQLRDIEKKVERLTSEAEEEENGE